MTSCPIGFVPLVLLLRLTCHLTSGSVGSPEAPDQASHAPVRSDSRLHPPPLSQKAAQLTHNAGVHSFWLAKMDVTSQVLTPALEETKDFRPAWQASIRHRPKLGNVCVKLRHMESFKRPSLCSRINSVMVSRWAKSSCDFVQLKLPGRVNCTLGEPFTVYICMYALNCYHIR